MLDQRVQSLGKLYYDNSSQGSDNRKLVNRKNRKS